MPWQVYADLQINAQATRIPRDSIIEFNRTGKRGVGLGWVGLGFGVVRWRPGVRGPMSVPMFAPVCAGTVNPETFIDVRPPPASPRPPSSSATDQTAAADQQLHINSSDLVTAPGYSVETADSKAGLRDSGAATGGLVTDGGGGGGIEVHKGVGSWRERAVGPSQQLACRQQALIVCEGDIVQGAVGGSADELMRMMVRGNRGAGKIQGVAGVHYDWPRQRARTSTPPSPPPPVPPPQQPAKDVPVASGQG